MAFNIVPVVVSFIFFVIVITLHFENINLMVRLFVKELKTLKSSRIYPNSTLRSIESSVWCYTHDNKKSCSFRNLCYVPYEKQFIFILSDQSILFGITNKNDLKTIDLSSIKNHNGFMMKLTVVTPSHSILKRNLISIKHGFILSRFKWDNIMHVIHDDLLPLFLTYMDVCLGNVGDCVSKYQLGFAEEGEMGPLAEWYNIFSSAEPILLQKGGSENIICFEEGRAGLPTLSVWFQYGFGVPQGPVPDTKLKGYVLRQFSDFVLHKFNVPNVGGDMNVVFFNRKINRRILNEDFVRNRISNIYKDNFPDGPNLQIFNLDLARNSTRLILTHLSQSKLVVGVHGSAMILSMFLQPGSAIVELFPFGINPQHVSPVRALCDVPSVGLLYSSWVNTKEGNTVVHPNAHPLHGGISHLSTDQQRQVQAMTTIPAVQCCHDAAYLYRMFQDTIVGSDIDVALNNAFQKLRGFSMQNFNEQSTSLVLSEWFFPAAVMNISCSVIPGDRGLNVRWVPPINARKPAYQVAVVIADGVQFSTSSDRPEVNVSLPRSVGGDVVVNVWVRVLSRENRAWTLTCNAGLPTLHWVRQIQSLLLRLLQ